jgi:hypothetical protein
MPSAAPRAFAGPSFRSRLVVEAEGEHLTLHHFDRDPAGAVFGTLWLIGWMAGAVMVTHGSAWSWSMREVLILAAMLGIWLLCAFAVLAALVQHNRLIVTGDSITYVARVLVAGRRKQIPLAEVTGISVQEKNAPRRTVSRHRHPRRDPDDRLRRRPRSPDAAQLHSADPRPLGELRARLQSLLRRASQASNRAIADRARTNREGVRPCPSSHFTQT